MKNINLIKLSDKLDFEWSFRSSPESNFVILFGKNKPYVEFQRNEQDSPQRPLEYDHKVDQFWIDLVEGKGKKLWNGKTLAIDGIHAQGDSLSVTYSETAYKDILFKKNLGLQELTRRYGTAAGKAHSFTCILPIDIRTHEILWGVVGRLTSQEPGIVDIIGGALDYQEPFSYELVLHKTLEEVEEELGTGLDAASVFPISLNYHDGCVFFVFGTFIHEEVLHQNFRGNEEIEKLVSADLTEVSRLPISPDVQFLLQYKDELEEQLFR